MMMGHWPPWKAVMVLCARQVGCLAPRQGAKLDVVQALLLGVQCEDGDVAGGVQPLVCQAVQNGHCRVHGTGIVWRCWDQGRCSVRGLCAGGEGVCQQNGWERLSSMLSTLRGVWGH